MQGGAIYATSTSLKISDSMFRQNRAPNGGAIALYGSNADLEDCAFEQNEATSGDGHMLWTYGSSNPEDRNYNAIVLTRVAFGTPPSNSGDSVYMIHLSQGEGTPADAYSSLVLHECNATERAVKAEAEAHVVYRKSAHANLTVNSTAGGYKHDVDDGSDAASYCDASSSFRWLHKARTVICTCLAGSYRSAESRCTNVKCTKKDPLLCTACPVGYYQANADVKECTACSVGKYNDATGAKACVVCNAGMYAAKDGSTTCETCAAGSFTNTGAKVGAATCTPCAAGKYSTISKVDTCSNCPAGKYAAADSSTACTACRPGQFQESDAKSLCDPCISGMYQESNEATACVACSKGKYVAATGSDSTNNCADCRAGTYQDKPGGSRCIECDAGKYVAEVASTSMDVCKDCPAGKFQPNKGQGLCESCNAGKSSAAKGSSNVLNCTACGPGQYSGKQASTACETCAQGSIVTKEGGASPVVLEGTKCTACPAGQYSTSATEACVPCGKGRYVAATGSDSTNDCADCRAGTYQDKPGGSRCIECDAGKYVAEVASTSMDVCKDCPAGKFQPNKGQGLCESCNAGKYGTANGSSTAINCIACSAGMFVAAAGSDKATDCISCRAGTYQEQAAQTSCIECDAGKHAPDEGLNASSACEVCPAGSITNTGARTGASVCRPCSAGTYSSSSSASSCTNCKAGKAAKAFGSTKCVFASNPGHFLASGIEVACPPGKFQPSQGMPSCKLCDADKYAGTNGLSSCKTCPSGYFQKHTGKAFCKQPFRCLGIQYIVQIDQTTQDYCSDCPQPGAVCNGINKSYTGNFWHAPSVRNPNTSTNMYACLNDGCPDEGDRVMVCKDGYEGPLCAVCSKGYFPQLRKCTDCGGSGPSLAAVALFSVSLLFVCGLAVMVYRHRRFLTSTGIFAHVKILVSFATVLLTVDRQFGLTWPPAFQQALAALSVLSLDFGILGSLLCMVNLSFYANLLCTTLLLVALLGVVYMIHALLQCRHRQATSAHPPDHPETLAKAAEIRQSALFVAIYLLLFAYPVVSVKVVELFGCHNVEGTYYLRADYSLECYTPAWTAMAVYASVFLVAYVVGFPLFIGAKLWSYRHALQKQVQGPGQVCKLAPPGLLLGFLLDDYVLRSPCFMWETVEMGRKLSLSVIGNFWSSKSVMCVATALVISLVFQLGHTHYKPFKSPACNRLQQICLSVLNAVYIVGLLLKTEAVATSDERDVGILLVLLLVSSMLALGCGIVLEIRFLRRAWARTRKLTQLLKKLPQQDPPDNDEAFYDIQIPVEESNMGDAFKPKKPKELAHLTEESKLAVVRQLSDENEGALAAFLDHVSHDPTVPLQQVTTPTLVKSEGRMCVEWGRKTEESIVKKACRPEIRAKNPKFGIEHLRDTFRFRATVFSFRDIVEFILAMHADPSLSGQGGLAAGNVDKEGNWLIMGEADPKKTTSGKEAKAGNVAKLDIKKLVKPRKTGWRFMALDFIMPNHQIVECYIRFFEMFQVADLKPAEYGDNGASVCPKLSQHEIFEKWRVIDCDNLEGEQLAEYERDMQESNRRFDQAFRQVLSHTSQFELQEFGKLFTMDDGKTLEAWAELLNMHTDSTPAGVEVNTSRRVSSNLDLGIGTDLASDRQAADHTVVYANPLHGPADIIM
eukprot:g111.t1